MATSDSMLLDWLAGPVLTELGTATDVKPGRPMPLPGPFYQTSPSEVVGVNVEYDAVSGQRTSATFVDANSPSRRVETQARTRRYATAMGSRENVGFDAEFISLIQSNVPILQARAKRLQLQKVRDFRFRIENLKVDMVHSAIALGAIYADGSGNILPSSSGAVVSVNFNQTYMGSNAIAVGATLPNTTVVTVDWNTTSNDVEGQIRAIADSYAYTTGYALGGFIYGRNAPTYMSTNTSMQAFLSRNQIYGRQFLDTNEIADGMLGIPKWTPGHRAFMVDQNNAVQQWFDKDSIYAYPEITPDWYENFECSLPVPAGIPYAGSFEQLEDFSNTFPLVKGYGAYCYGSMDPISLTCVQQWFGLPTIKSPLLWQIKIH